MYSRIKLNNILLLLPRAVLSSYVFMRAYVLLLAAYQVLNFDLCLFFIVLLLLFLLLLRMLLALCRTLFLCMVPIPYIKRISGTSRHNIQQVDRWWWEKKRREEDADTCGNRRRAGSFCAKSWGGGVGQANNTWWHRMTWIIIGQKIIHLFGSSFFFAQLQTKDTGRNDEQNGSSRFANPPHPLDEDAPQKDCLSAYNPARGGRRPRAVRCGIYNYYEYSY